ncbi:MAG: hypothetical protein J7M32_02430 [Deltaproteobacteria bacterium]|nr:hypothetical protein [Deltaproteobacteria bacterium]OQX65919.1 MAG: hypothetical protein B5M55_02215 [Desulfococcus sp. 4484_242]
MDARKVLAQLEGAAEQLGLKIRYEPVEGETGPSLGGMCRIRGRPVIIINSKAAPADQVHILVKALRRLDLNRIYLRPGIRELLEGNPGERELPP